MGIVVNVNSFVNVSSTPAFQNWQSPTPSNFIHYQVGGALIYPAIVSILFKTIFGTPDELGYSQFRIKTRKIYVGTTNIDWLLASSAFFGANLSGVFLYNQLTNSDPGDTLTLSIQNLNLVNIGIHECRINFTIEGLNSSGVWSEISFYDHIVYLKVYENEQISWSPNDFILTHYQATPKPEKTLNISGLDWTIITPVNFILESSDPEVTIIPQNYPWGTSYKASGYGDRLLTLKIADYWNTLQALFPSLTNHSLTVMSGVSTVVGSINFSLNILTPGDFLVLPDSLNYEATKGGIEPMPIDVFVFSENAYTIESPAWLQIIPSQENSPGNFANLNVVPISHSNLSGGNYQGVIKLTSIVVGSDVSIEIPVTYVLHEFVSSPYSTTLFNFTKDPLFFEFYTQTNDTYFDIKMNVEIFDWHFQTGLSKNYVIPFKVPLYNKRQRENIGLRIDKMISRLANPLFENSNLYNAANVNLEITEKTYPAHEVVRNTTLTTIKFLAGVTPKIKNGNTAFLEISEGTKRIANAKFDFVNLLLQPGQIYDCEIFRNGTSIEQFQITSLTPSYLYVMDFESIEPVLGDVIEFKVFVNATDFISKKYIVFPEAEYSNMILWEDEFKLVQSYEFTGKHLVKPDFTYQNSNQKRNLIDYIKSVDSKNTQKISLNSGFIPKSDREIIMSILASKRLWVYIDENNLVEMVNETKSIVYDDIDRELISFDLEFTINKKRHEENNSF